MKTKLLVTALTLFASPAFAGTQGLTFAEIREACQNPSKFQNQIAPTNLQVTCEEKVQRWQSDTVQQKGLPCSRQVSASLTSDKYQMSPTQHPMDIQQQSASCPAFKEVLEVTSFTKATSCEELLATQGTEHEFCASLLERARQSNPKLVQVTETGRTVDFCTQHEQQKKSGGQGGQGGQGWN